MAGSVVGRWRDFRRIFSESKMQVIYDEDGQQVEVYQGDNLEGRPVELAILRCEHRYDENPHPTAQDFTVESVLKCN